MQCIQSTSLSNQYAAKGLHDNQLHTNGTQASYRLQMSNAQLWHTRHATAKHGYAMAAHWCEDKRWNRQAFRNTPKAQCAFKSLLIHEILLFSMFITLCCTLHHHPSQDIQCWKLWRIGQIHPKARNDKMNKQGKVMPRQICKAAAAAHALMADIPECMCGSSEAAYPHICSQHPIIVLLS